MTSCWFDPFSTCPFGVLGVKVGAAVSEVQRAVRQHKRRIKASGGANTEAWLGLVDAAAYLCCCIWSPELTQEGLLDQIVQLGEFNHILDSFSFLT